MKHQFKDAQKERAICTLCQSYGVSEADLDRQIDMYLGWKDFSRITICNCDADFSLNFPKSDLITNVHCNDSWNDFPRVAPDCRGWYLCQITKDGLEYPKALCWTGSEFIDENDEPFSQHVNQYRNIK